MKQLFLLLAGFVIFISCNKVTEPDSLGATLRQGKWKLSAATVVEKGYRLDTTFNVTADTIFFPNCMRDDYVVFRDNTAGEVNAGATTCTPTEVALQPFTWSVENNNRTLNADGASRFFFTDNLRAEVTDFSASKFGLKYTFYRQNIRDYSLLDTFRVTASYTKI